MDFKRVLMCVVFVSMLMAPAQGVLAELTAGDFDDNLNFDHFLEYNDEADANDNADVLPDLDVDDRVTIKVTDKDGDPFSNARVRITSDPDGKVVIDSDAASNGVFYFFPTHDGAGKATTFTVEVAQPGATSFFARTPLDLAALGADRTLRIEAEGQDASLPDALDIMLVIDTTGSMSDELRYIVSEYSDIIGDVKGDYADVPMRFGLIVYRDEGDAYVTKSYGFTDSLQTMQGRLNEQNAGGGGDYPEAMHKALKDAMAEQWTDGNAAKILFLVADAPPHNDKLDATMEAIDDARSKGIHIYPLASSGVRDTAEFMMRSASLLTNGRYMFLTDDSGIGNSHAEPHIPCYIVTELSDLMSRVVSSELAGKRVEPKESDIKRTVGNYHMGVCLAPGQEPGDDDDGGSGDDDTPPPPPPVEPSDPAPVDPSEPGTTPVTGGYDRYDGGESMGPYPTKGTSEGGTTESLKAAPGMTADVALLAVLVVAGMLLFGRRVRRRDG